MSSSVFQRSLVSQLAVAAAVALGACGANNSGSTSVQCRALSAPATSRPAGLGGSVFVVVMENHSQSDIFGNPQAPFINGLAASGAVAAGYHDSYVHPSEPNYIWMIAGENFGILDDGDPGRGHTIASTSHLADQIEQAGLTWKSYQESMGGTCGLASHDTYAAKHNPFAFFDDINGFDGQTFQPSARCNQHIVDYTQLDVDLASGSVPTYVFITPNLQNDMHDGTVAQGDAWLAREIPKIFAADAYKNGGVLFLVWDEGSSQSDDPPLIVVSPAAKTGYVSKTPYDTSALLKTQETLLGVEALPCNPQPDSVSVMSDLFTVPLAPATGVQ